MPAGGPGLEADLVHTPGALGWGLQKGLRPGRVQVASSGLQPAQRAFQNRQRPGHARSCHVGCHQARLGAVTCRHLLGQTRLQAALPDARRLHAGQGQGVLRLCGVEFQQAGASHGAGKDPGRRGAVPLGVMAWPAEQAEQNGGFVAHHHRIEQSFGAGVFALGHGQRCRNDRVARVHHGFAVHIVHFMAAAQAAVPAGRLCGLQAAVPTNPNGTGRLFGSPPPQNIAQLGRLPQMRASHPVDQLQCRALAVLQTDGPAQSRHQPFAPGRWGGVGHHWPLKWGGRFSLKASTPSRRSSVSTSWL